MSNDFLEPTRLWLLLVVPALIGLYVVLQYRKRHYAVRFTNMALLDTVAPRRVNWRQHVAVLLALSTLALSIVLFAKPVKTVKVPLSINTPVTVVLTMDVSLSMSAADVPPNRITAAKHTAIDFVNKLPARFKISVVSFSKAATVNTPPTTDHAQVVRAITGLHLGPYTATGEGIFTSLDVIKQALAGTKIPPGGHVPALIVLLSDGKRTWGRSQVSAAEAAKSQGVKIYTVALGTPGGMIVAQGQAIPVPVEVNELRQISQITGGKTYLAQSPNDLVNAYKSVDHQLTYRTGRGDATSAYVGYLVLLALLSTASGLFIASRWP
ncbi:MAG: VWA domain-containing protein [Nocardioidaceae bacterium]